MNFPVPIQTKKIPTKSNQVNVYYPQVVLTDKNVQRKINNEIISTLNKLLVEQNYYSPDLVELLANFEIKTNERKILSLNLIVYSFTGGAHGMTIVRSLTFDVTTGRTYTLAQLFKPNSNYVDIISNIVKQRLQQWDIMLLQPFTKIRPDQDFYLADNSIVIYFQLYEISPYVQGFPYVPIPILDLQSIMNPDGPLPVLLPFT